MYWEDDQRSVLLKETARHNNEMYARFHDPDQDNLQIKSEFKGTKKDPILLEDLESESPCQASSASRSPPESSQTFIESLLATCPDLYDVPASPLRAISRDSSVTVRNTAEKGESSAMNDKMTVDTLNSTRSPDRRAGDESSHSVRGRIVPSRSKPLMDRYERWSIVEFTYKALPQELSLVSNTVRTITLANDLTHQEFRARVESEVEALLRREESTRKFMDRTRIKIWIGRNYQTLAAAAHNRCLGDYLSESQLADGHLPRLFVQLELTLEEESSTTRPESGTDFRDPLNSRAAQIQSSSTAGTPKSSKKPRSKNILSKKDRQNGKWRKPILPVLRGERTKNANEPWWLLGQLKQSLPENEGRKNAIVARIYPNRTMRLYSNAFDQCGNVLKARPKNFKLASVDLKPEFQACGRSRPALLKHLLRLHEQVHDDSTQSSVHRDSSPENSREIRQSVAETPSSPGAVAQPLATTTPPGQGRKFKGVGSVFARRYGDRWKSVDGNSRMSAISQTTRNTETLNQPRLTKGPGGSPVTSASLQSLHDNSTDADRNNDEDALNSGIDRDSSSRKRKRGE